MTVYSYSSSCPSRFTHMEKRAGEGDLGDKKAGSLILSLVCLPWQNESWEGMWRLYIINVRGNPVEIEIIHGNSHSQRSKWA